MASSSNDFASAATAVETFLAALLDADVDKLSSVWNPLARAYSCGKSEEDHFIAEYAWESVRKSVASWRQASERHHAGSRILALERREGAPGTPQDGVIVWSQVEVALPPRPLEGNEESEALHWAKQEDVILAAVVVLFKLPRGWKIISTAYSCREMAASHMTIGMEVAKADMLAVRLCVEQYFQGGHSSSPEAMSRAYHSCCRLTAPSSQEDGGMVCWDRDEFFTRVDARPLSADHPMVVRHDHIAKVLLAGPGLAQVVCCIAYPPILFTDILTLLKLGKAGQWWIVCKSSLTTPIPCCPDDKKPITS